MYRNFQDTIEFLMMLIVKSFYTGLKFLDLDI